MFIREQGLWFGKSLQRDLLTNGRTGLRKVQEQLFSCLTADGKMVFLF